MEVVVVLLDLFLCLLLLALILVVDHKVNLVMGFTVDCLAKHFQLSVQHFDDRLKALEEKLEGQK
jgi:hypothetical protein